MLLRAAGGERAPSKGTRQPRHTHGHTHAAFPRGIFPAWPSFPGVLRRKKKPTKKERERARRGERHGTVMGMALYIALKIVLVIKSMVEGEEEPAAHRCRRGMPGVGKPVLRGWSRRAIIRAGN